MVTNQCTVGCGIREGVVSEHTGIVTAIFGNSIHLTAQNSVFTLGAKQISNHPFTIRTNRFPKDVSIGDTFSLTRERLSIQRWSRRNLKYYLYSDSDMRFRNQVGRYSDTDTPLHTEIESYYDLDLTRLPIYTPCFKTSYIVSEVKIVRELQASRTEAMLTTGIEGFFPLLIGNIKMDQVSQKVKPSLDGICWEIRKSDWPEFAKHAEKIVGVGIGLTPSGDDFLSGVFAALYFYNTTFKKGFPVDNLKSLAEIVGKRTSLFSATLMRAAAQGWVSDTISSWLVSLFQGESKRVKGLTREIVKIGHSSGADMLLGLVTALEAIYQKSKYERVLKITDNVSTQY